MDKHFIGGQIDQAMEQSSQLKEIISNINNNTSDIRDLYYQINALADRLYGAQPEASEGKTVPEPYGIIASVNYQLSEQRDAISYLRSQIRRLQEL